MTNENQAENRLKGMLDRLSVAPTTTDSHLRAALMAAHLDGVSQNMLNELLNISQRVSRIHQ